MINFSVISGHHGCMAARDLVFQPGDRVRTSGRFVSGPDGDWLDLQRVHDLTIKPPGWKSDLSIRLIGADAAAVPSEFGPSPSPRPNPSESPPNWLPGPTPSPKAYSSSARQSPPPEIQQPDRQAGG